MKIAFVKPPATYANWYKQPALGIAYMVSSLEAKGFDCKIFDAYFENLSLHVIVDRVKDYNPDVIGISAMTHEINLAAEIASKLKEALDVPIVVGGCHVTALPEKTLQEFEVFDYGVYGEGEKTVSQLLECIEFKNIAPHDIKGLVFRENGKIVVNPSREFMDADELDALPMPAFHQYYGVDNPKALAGKKSYYMIFTSRGCPYQCAFCMRVLGRKVRRRSVQNIIKEMKYAIEKYGAHTFDFADEIFLFDNAQTRELLQLFIDRGLSKKIKWSALTRANFVKHDLIALAKKAGCVRLEMGVESGDDNILNNINKKITTDQVRYAVKVIKDEKISLGTYFILGHPGETIDTVRKTVDFAVELNTDSIAVGLMVPYPGTAIWDMASQETNGYSLLSQQWDQYDKYGGKVLEIEGLSYEQLAKWQKKALLNLYLKNFRFVDCFKYFWKRRNALYFMMKEKIASIRK